MPALREGRRDGTFCALVHAAEQLRATQWRDYLADCRAHANDAGAEEAAWRRLQARLQAIEDELAGRLYTHRTS